MSLTLKDIFRFAYYVNFDPELLLVQAAKEIKEDKELEKVLKKYRSIRNMKQYNKELDKQAANTKKINRLTYNSSRKSVLGYTVAFANEKGGYLVFGLEDAHPHTVCGSNAYQGREGQLEQDVYRDTELAFDLRKERKVTGCVTLKLRYSNFETFSKQAKISYTCSDKLLLQKVMDLFQRLYSRRMLIRLIGVKLSDLVTGSYQIDLFNDVIEDLNLMQAVDSIRMSFGVEKIHRGVCF